ncbi:MAG: hypothetical protein B7Z66_12390 [Chromatiales bacterium 21-64-14]|nr:MAG: hypothetical protein B7Z66_12390 [Chromatiales bacterium 21-64-14]
MAPSAATLRATARDHYRRNGAVVEPPPGFHPHKRPGAARKRGQHRTRSMPMTGGGYAAPGA